MIQLFHAGTEHVVNGITCNSILVNEFGFEHLLDDGWHFKPEDCYPKEAPKAADSKVTVSAKSGLEKTPNAEKPDKTATKTAVKK